MGLNTNPENDVEEYDSDEEIERAEAWNGDLDSLNSLAKTIKWAWKDRDMEVVELLCSELLSHNNLPPLHRGRFEAYMSLMDDEEADELLDAAATAFAAPVARALWRDLLAAGLLDDGTPLPG